MRIFLAIPLAAGCVLAATAGCATGAGNPGPGATVAITTAAPGSATPGATATVPPTKTSTSSAPAWPTPEDCIGYNPNNISVHYEAGIYQVNSGSTVVMRLPGGPGETVGDKGEALARRFSKHCFLGRGNTREDKNSYVFDYWRNPSGNTPGIPEQEDDCSPYDRHNLTVEDMGSGYGWRVKDHDHVLHLFDNESDARAGKLVLAKYSQICFIGNSGDDDPDLVSYLL